MKPRVALLGSAVALAVTGLVTAIGSRSPVEAARDRRRGAGLAQAKGHVGDATRLVGRPTGILTTLAEAAGYDRVAGIDRGRRTIRDLEARVVRGRLETLADAPG